MTFWDFADKHTADVQLTLFMLLFMIVVVISRTAFLVTSHLTKVARMRYRSESIVAQGWPPEHCDGDGDGDAIFDQQGESGQPTYQYETTTTTWPETKDDKPKDD